MVSIRSLAVDAHAEIQMHETLLREEFKKAMKTVLRTF